MRLICELCAERGLAAIINIHDVALAQMFVERIVGLQARAELAFDGKPVGPDRGCSDQRSTAKRTGTRPSAKSTMRTRKPRNPLHERGPA
jgi:ABC-type phosphate/phosphonate transport system ATPase subunit